MSVLIHRVSLYDSGWTKREQPQVSHDSAYVTHQPVAAYSFQLSTKTSSWDRKPTSHAGSVAVCRVRPQPLPPATVAAGERWMQLSVMDRSVPNPFGNSDLTKYWNQRRRLFSRFDHGVQLDDEGWFSVTPEQIADHVASRLYQLSEARPMVVLDAFCGCGGNAIAFAKLPNVTVLAVDVDRAKLRRAAHNAAIYGIPPHKLAFVECNVLFILEHCYRQGDFVLDQPIATPELATKMMAAMPPPVATEIVEGFSVGGIDVLPRRVDAVFMDPPWGGVDYSVFGKNGYDLHRNMKIRRPLVAAPPDAPSAGDGLDDFFDSFQAQTRSKSERKAQFNSNVDDANCVNGAELVAIAAAATAQHIVIYDLPKNVNRTSLGNAALAAGYRGNCKLEEHFLNGRLKTVTAYMGSDWSNLVSDIADTSTTGTATP
jgi:trimethylguanosine synthase